MNRERFDEKLRENRARLVRPAVRKQFAEKLDHPPDAIEFVGLSATERIGARFTERWKSILKRKEFAGWSRILYSSRRDDFDTFVGEVRNRFHDTPAVLLHDRSREAGGIRVPLQEVLSRLDALLEFEGEDVLVSDEEMTCGLAIEHFLDRMPDGSAKVVYRCCAWQETA